MCWLQDCVESQIVRLLTLILQNSFFLGAGFGSFSEFKAFDVANFRIALQYSRL